MGQRDTGLAFLLGALPVFTISVCSRATDNMVSTTLPLLGKYVFGLGTIYGGIATSSYFAAGLVANYFVNPRLTRGLRQYVFVATSGLTVIFTFLLAAANSITALALGLAISFGLGIIYPSLIAATSLVGGQKGERLLAVYSLGLSVSLVLGPSLESYLLTLSYADVFYIFAAISVLSFAASWKVRFVDIPEETWKLGRDATHGINSGVLVSGVFFLPFGAFTAFLPIYATMVFGVGTAIAYTAFIPMFVVSVVARSYMAARPFKHLKTPILASFLVTAFGILALVMIPSFALFLVVMAMLGIPHGVTYTASLIMVSRTSVESERNTAVSRLLVWINAFKMLMPLAIAAVIEAVGIHLSFVFLLVPAIGCAAALRLRYWGSVD